MKRFVMFLASGVAVLTMSGCGGGSSGGSSSEVYVPVDGSGSSSEVYVPVDDGFTTLFLVDQDGFAYAGVPYICDSMSEWSVTASSGEFSFYVGEYCDFNFDGLYGNYDDDPLVDDIVYIVDDLDSGKGGIPYECDSFIGINTTNEDGSFYYDENDACTFDL